MNLKTIILGFIIITSTACQSNLLKNALNGTSEKAAEDAVVTTMSTVSYTHLPLPTSDLV